MSSDGTVRYNFTNGDRLDEIETFDDEDNDPLLINSWSRVDYPVPFFIIFCLLLVVSLIVNIYLVLRLRQNRHELLSSFYVSYAVANFLLMLTGVVEFVIITFLHDWVGDGERAHAHRDLCKLTSFVRHSLLFVFAYTTALMSAVQLVSKRRWCQWLMARRELSLQLFHTAVWILSSFMNLGFLSHSRYTNAMYQSYCILDYTMGKVTAASLLFTFGYCLPLLTVAATNTITIHLLRRGNTKTCEKGDLQYTELQPLSSRIETNGVTSTTSGSVLKRNTSQDGAVNAGYMKNSGTEQSLLLSAEDLSTPPKQVTFEPRPLEDLHLKRLDAGRSNWRLFRVNILVTAMSVVLVVWWLPQHMSYFGFFTAPPEDQMQPQTFEGYIITVLMIYTFPAVSGLLLLLTVAESPKLMRRQRERSDLQGLLGETKLDGMNGCASVHMEK